MVQDIYDGSGFKGFFDLWQFMTVVFSDAGSSQVFAIYQLVIFHAGDSVATIVFIVSTVTTIY